MAIGQNSGDPGDESAVVLHHAEQEARTVADLWAPHPVDIVLGDAAQWKEFQGTELGSYQAIHIATHTTVSQGRDGQSAIRLAGNETAAPLTIPEVRELRLHADLVFLSSCEGALQGASGVGSFAEAFLHAGAEAVLASSLLVDDAAGRALAEGFYRHWLGGKNRAASLQAAQLELGSIDERWKHPFYWSSFQLYRQP